jgi:hypothetical protein
LTEINPPLWEGKLEKKKKKELFPPKKWGENC